MPLTPVVVSAHTCTQAFPGNIRPYIAFGSTFDLHIRRKQTKRVSPLVEIEVCRSTRLKIQKGGFKHKTCDDKRYWPCDSIPHLLSTKIIRNLCIDYCKVPPEEATEDKLAKERTKKTENDDKQSENGKNKKNSQLGTRRLQIFWGMVSLQQTTLAFSVRPSLDCSKYFVVAVMYDTLRWRYFALVNFAQLDVLSATPYLDILFYLLLPRKPPPPLKLRHLSSLASLSVSRIYWPDPFLSGNHGQAMEDLLLEC